MLDAKIGLFLLFKEVAVLKDATAFVTSYHLKMKSKIVTAISALKRKPVDTVQINNLRVPTHVQFYLQF
jgi:hypothetical protein